MKQWSDLQVGDTVWFLDPNRRVYRKDVNGRSYGSPIYREYFRSVEIVRETSRSWVTRYGDKYSKKEQPQNVYTDVQAVEDVSWIEDNKIKIIDAIYKVKDITILRQIAVLVGYEESK